MDVPEPWIVDAVERATGNRPERWRKTQGGYTPASRWVVTFSDGTSAFVKAATTPATAQWLGFERAFYETVRASFVATMLGWDDAGPWPVLVLEDLSGATWPPPWDDARVAAVVNTLGAVARTAGPPGLPRLAGRAPKMFRGWDEVARDPAPFLSLGMCSAGWLDEALPALLSSQRMELCDGTGLVHFDVRSDNLCFAQGRTVLVDWNLPCIGNPLFDVAFWLPSLECEGGPAPEQVSEQAGSFAGMVAGYFAANAGKPVIPDAPFVRRVQREQLSTALPWAARSLGLPSSLGLPPPG